MRNFDWLQMFAMEQPEPGVSADAAPEEIFQHPKQARTREFLARYLAR